MINEFDPSRCPTISSDRASPAAMYSEPDNGRAAAYTQEPIGNDPRYQNDQLSRIESQLQEEMENSKMVSKTYSSRNQRPKIPQQLFGLYRTASLLRSAAT